MTDPASTVSAAPVKLVTAGRLARELRLASSGPVPGV
jgi:hypothetical protein